MINANEPSRLPSQLLTRAEAASYLRRSPGTLANWATRKTGPPFYRLEDGKALYSADALSVWLEEQNVEMEAS